MFGLLQYLHKANALGDVDDATFLKTKRLRIRLLIRELVVRLYTTVQGTDLKETSSLDCDNVPECATDLRRSDVRATFQCHVIPTAIALLY